MLEICINSSAKVGKYLRKQYRKFLRAVKSIFFYLKKFVHSLGDRLLAHDLTSVSEISLCGHDKKKKENNYDQMTKRDELAAT